MDEILDKASKSPFAGRLKLRTKVVLARAVLSAARVDELAAEGDFALPALGRDDALLEIGGVAVAAGRIVGRGEKRYFKIRRMLDPAPEAAQEVPMFGIPEGHRKEGGGAK